MIRERREIGAVLTNKPVEELLEGLATEGPEENKRIRLSEAAFKPVKDGGFRQVIELILEDGRPDPGPYQDKDDGYEGDLGAGLDVDRLSVKKCCDHERREDTREVGEEG